MTDACCYYDGPSTSRFNTLCAEYTVDTACVQNTQNYDCVWRDDDDDNCPTSSGTSSTGCCKVLKDYQRIEDYCTSETTQSGCEIRPEICEWIDDCSGDVVVAGGDTNSDNCACKSTEDESSRAYSVHNRYCGLYGTTEQECNDLNSRDNTCTWSC